MKRKKKSSFGVCLHNKKKSDLPMINPVYPPLVQFKCWQHFDGKYSVGYFTLITTSTDGCPLVMIFPNDLFDGSLFFWRFVSIQRRCNPDGYSLLSLSMTNEIIDVSLPSVKPPTLTNIYLYLFLVLWKFWLLQCLHCYPVSKFFLI